MGSRKQTTNTTQHQTQTNAPPSWTAPGLADVAGRVTNAVSLIPQTHYSGPMVATMNPDQLKGITDAWGATAGNAGQLAGWLQNQLPQLQAIAGGGAFTQALPDTSYALADRQGLDGVIKAAIDPVQKQLMEQTLPAIVNSALQSGAYSGSRATGVLPQTAIRDATDSQQRIAAQLGYEDYNNYENRRLQAYQATTGAQQGNVALQNQQLATQLQAMGMAPEYVNSILHTQASQGDLLRMAAELQQQQTQLGYQDAVQRDQYASQSPFMGLDTASNLLAALSGNWGTQTSDMTGKSVTKSTPSTMDMISQGIQAATAVASLAMGMPTGASALGTGATAGQMFAPSSGLMALAQPTGGTGNTLAQWLAQNPTPVLGR